MGMKPFLFASVLGKVSGNKGKTGCKKDEDTEFFLGILAVNIVRFFFLSAILALVQRSLNASIFFFLKLLLK